MKSKYALPKLFSVLAWTPIFVMQDSILLTQLDARSPLYSWMHAVHWLNASLSLRSRLALSTLPSICAFFPARANARLVAGVAAGASRTGLAQAGLNAPLSAVGRCAANAKALLHRLHPYRDVVHRKIFFLFFPIFLFSALLIPFSFFLLFI